MKHLSVLIDLGKTLFRFSPVDCVLTLSFMLFRSVTSGVGLLLILPLLNIIGIPIAVHGNDWLTQKITLCLATLHLPLTLISILLVFILILALVATTHFFEEITRSRWQERYQHHTLETTYNLLIHTKWAYFVQKNNAEVLHGLTTQLQASWQCHYQLLTLLNQFILISVYVSLSCLVSWQMTLVASVIAIFLLCLMFPLHRLIAQAGHYALRRNQTLFQAFYEQLGILKMIKSCNKESAFIAKTLQVNLLLKQQMQRTMSISATSKWLYSIGSAIAFSGLLYIAIEKLKLPINSILLLLLVFSRLLPKVSSLQQTYQQILRVLPLYSNLTQLRMDCLANQEKAKPHKSEPIAFQQTIAFEQVSFSYCPENLPPVIQQFSMCIRKNTTTALIGPSGVGKTTVADLIVGLLEPTHGAIYIDKQRLHSENLVSWRKSVAYVTQTSLLLNASIRDNLQLFSGPVSEAALWRALHDVFAAEFVSKLDQGLDTPVGDKGIRLSGGECQRIGLARALLMKPELLILDESTNSLDVTSIQNIQQLLKKLRGKLTIIIISHQAEMCEFTDQIISLKPTKPILNHGDIAWTSSIPA